MGCIARDFMVSNLGSCCGKGQGACRVGAQHRRLDRRGATCVVPAYCTRQYGGARRQQKPEVTITVGHRYRGRWQLHIQDSRAASRGAASPYFSCSTLTNFKFETQAK